MTTRVRHQSILHVCWPASTKALEIIHLKEERFSDLFRCFCFSKLGFLCTALAVLDQSGIHLPLPPVMARRERFILARDFISQLSGSIVGGAFDEADHPSEEQRNKGRGMTQECSFPPKALAAPCGATD